MGTNNSLPFYGSIISGVPTPRIYTRSVVIALYVSDLPATIGSNINMSEQDTEIFGIRKDRTDAKQAKVSAASPSTAFSYPDKFNFKILHTTLFMEGGGGLKLPPRIFHSDHY